MLSAIVAEAALGFPWMLSALVAETSLGYSWLLSTFVVEVATWVPWTWSICMIRRRSFSELQWLELITDLTSLGSVEILQMCVWGGSLGVRFADGCCQPFVAEAAVGCCQSFVVEATSVGCCQPFVVEAASVLTVILSYQNLFVVSPMVRSINYFWVLPTLSITVKGKRFTSEYWIVSRFSVRWSSSSTILTLMAWRSNIPQKSFLCERLFIPS